MSAPVILAGVVGTCVLIPGLVLSLRRTRAFLVGWLVFFVLLLPTTGIIGFTIVIASDKYAYLPAVGLLMVLAWLLGNLWARPPARLRPAVIRTCILVLALLAAGGEAAATRRQITRWQDTEGLYRYMLTLAPQSARLHTILGEILADRGRPDEAIAEHQRALQLKPDYADVYNNLGIVLAQPQQGKLEEAAKCFERALRLWPDNPKAHSNLANALAIQGKLPDAVSHYERSLQLMPRSSETHNGLANAFLLMGKVPEAMQHYREAIRLDPDNAEARNNYGYALEMQGNRDQAARQYREALKIAPNYLQAQQGLQRLLDAKGAGSGPRSRPS
jgi:Flp pilus assembly protein TadD